MHETRRSIRRCERKCGGCGHVQSNEKLTEIEGLPDDGLWHCENCGREHCIV
jgi:hypothetical protein